MSELRLGVLVSGSGTNLQALLDACARESFPAQVACVVCNVPGARAIERAEAAGVPCVVVDHQEFESREAFDTRLVEVLREAEVELVCLAGFMRLVTETLLSAFPKRVINIHPSLLPAFPGLHAQRQALKYGVRVTGATVHFVDTGTDSGPVIIQSMVPVLPDDTEDSLQQRILVTEHHIYPEAVRLIAEGRVRILGRSVSIDDAAALPGDLTLYNPQVRDD